MKHGVDFETASLAFDDPGSIFFPERNVEGEERWITIGEVGVILILAVAHTVRDKRDDEIIRIISARKATPAARRRYEEG